MVAQSVSFFISVVTYRDKRKQLLSAVGQIFILFFAFLITDWFYL